MLLILLRHIFIVQIYIWDLAHIRKLGASLYTNISYSTIIDIHNIIFTHIPVLINEIYTHIHIQINEIYKPATCICNFTQ